MQNKEAASITYTKLRILHVEVWMGAVYYVLDPRRIPFRLPASTPILLRCIISVNSRLILTSATITSRTSAKKAKTTVNMATEAAARRFMSAPFFAVVGASSNPAKFGHKSRFSLLGL